MTVGVLTTCHTQYTWDRSVCIFLFNRTTLQVFVTYLTGALYVHHLWLYKHQHDNRVRSKLFVSCRRWWFQWRFAAILVYCAPSGEMHNYWTPHIIKGNSENSLIHRCNYISYLKCIVYDKLLKPRQSFLTLILLTWRKWWANNVSN